MHAPVRVSLDDVARHLDTMLRTYEVPDYPGAMNGVQVEHDGPVIHCAVAVDASLHTIDATAALNANLLVVHHGLFWGGSQPLRGRTFQRVRRLLAHDIAVYSSHLPLDLHPTLGNNMILARTRRCRRMSPIDSPKVRSPMNDICRHSVPSGCS